MDAPVAWSLEVAVSKYLDHGYQDGDLISHEWLAWALDLPTTADVQAQFVSMHRIDEFKQALLVDHRVFIVSDRGKGYRVVPPSDQAFVAVGQAMREVRRQFHKCGKIMQHTRMDELTAEQARRHTDAQVKMAALAGMVSREKLNVFKAFEGKTK